MFYNVIYSLSVYVTKLNSNANYQGAAAGHGETNPALEGEEDDDDDVVPEESDPESIHAKIVASRKNREKFAIKKSYSIEV